MALSSYLRIKNPSEPCTDMPTTLAYQYNFPLDPFQQHAIAAISRNENVLVTAKTGSGKTLVGEYQIAHSLARGRRVFYTTPIKSLSNQKFHDLKQMFPDRVGIMTGDIKFKPDADIVIMTTEILRNLLFKKGTATENLGLTASLSLDRLDAVVFDECHYINDRDRGAVWEETMILLPREVSLIMLSATIDQPEQFASWLGDLKEKPIHLISTQYRIVPLVHGVYRGTEFLPVMDSKDRFEGGLYNAWLLSRKGDQKEAEAHKAQVADRRRGGYEDGPVQRKGAMKSFTHQMNAMIGELETKELLPALFFVFSRKDCERYADLVEHTLISSSDTASVKHILDFHLHRFGDELRQMAQYNTLRALLEKGIAFHHSGLLPVLKEIVEILFGKGFIKVLFATETFAVGINMPTKTVVFTSYRKYDDAVGGMRLLNTDEYIQMAGRAGRRGKDVKGTVLYLPDREPEGLDDVRRMMTGRRATFQSRMTFHYDFLLKTLQSKNLRWLEIMRQSYWYKRHDGMKVECRRELEKERAAIEGIGLTEAEEAAMVEFEALQLAVKESVNAKRREAQRALETWKQRRVGPRWWAVEKELWPKLKKGRSEVAGLEADLAALEEPQRDVMPTLDALVELGFVEMVEGEVRPTGLGTMASEVNEGHGILMPLYFQRGLSRAGLKTPEEVLGLLAVFLGEGGKGEEVIHPDRISVSTELRNGIREIQRMAGDCLDVETRRRVLVPRTKGAYWDIQLNWVEPIWRWVHGATLPELSADYGIFEGNFIRILSKLGNVLEEWKVLATLAADTEMLNLLAEAGDGLKTGIASSDSLYLRL